MDFIVVDLYSDKNVPRSTVVQAAEAVYKFVNEKFAPIWGVGANIKILPRGKIPKITDNTKNIVYLFDIVAVSASYSGIAGHNIVLPPPLDLIDGPQPQYYIPQVPLVPLGTPYILIPYGDSTLTYGLLAAFSATGKIHRPGFSLADVLSTALSHEVMETIGDIFDGVNYLGAYQMLTPDFTTNQTYGYLREVCDPVQWGSFNFLTVDGLKVQNFVTPDYFNPYPAPTTKLDFLGNVHSPFTPYGGVQYGYLIQATEFDNVTLTSESTNPTTVTTDISPIYGGSTSVRKTNRRQRI